MTFDRTLMTSVDTRWVAGALRHASQDRYSAICAQEHQPQGVQSIATTGILFFNCLYHIKKKKKPITLQLSQ